MSDTLLEAARNYLDYTWADEAADRKLTGILERMRAENPELVLDMRRTRSYV